MISDVIGNISVKEIVLIGVIIALLAVVIVLFMYSIVLRVLSNRRNAYFERKRTQWEDVLLHFITDTGMDIGSFSVAEREWMKFAEFIENYLIDLTGEDHEAIIELLRRISFPALLMKALDSSDHWERAYSAYFTGLMKYHPAESKLVDLVYDSSSVVSIVAFEALNKIGSRKDLPGVLKFLLNSPSVSTTRVYEIILDYGTDINAILIDLLRDTSIDDRGKRLILDVLTVRTVVESLDAVMHLAYETHNNEILIGCIKAIGAFGGPENIDFLMVQLSSPDWAVRSQAVRAMGNISSPMIIPELKMRIRTDSSYWVRLYSAQSIKNFGEHGKRELQSILALAPPEHVSSVVNYVLYEMGD